MKNVAFHCESEQEAKALAETITSMPNLIAAVDEGDKTRVVVEVYGGIERQVDYWQKGFRKAVECLSKPEPTTEVLESAS